MTHSGGCNFITSACVAMEQNVLLLACHGLSNELLLKVVKGHNVSK